MLKYGITLIFCLLSFVTTIASPSTDKSIRIQAVASSSSITLNWSSYVTATGYTIHRKLKSSTNWGSSIASLSGSTTTYIDNSVSINTYYEYRITRSASVGTAYGYVSAGINLQAIDYRGKIVLVIDNTFSSLQSQIQTLKNDLRGDGWQVIELIVSRNDTPQNVRNQIKTIYNSDPSGVKSLLLLGHIPVYRSGNIAPDGHDPIPWAADSYYAEMVDNWNSPPTSLSSDVELEVGRIDLFNLPAFGQTEIQLMSNYLNKLHAFKIRQWAPQDRMLIQDNLTWVSNPLAEMAYRASGPLVGLNSLIEIPSYNFPNYTARMNEGWLFGYGSGGGSYTSADGIGTTTNFVNSPCNVVFNILLGSYFGNWDCSTGVPNWNNNTNNFLRAPLASGNALTSIYGGLPNWALHHMGMGDPIGYSTKISMNNRTSNATYLPQNGGWQGQGYTTIHLGLMGDPTLRMKYILPATNLTVNGGSQTTFNWNASADASLGYHIYVISSGVPVRINSNVIVGTTYTTNNAYPTGTEFMIRAIKVQSGFSGSYQNSSIGTFVTLTQNLNPIKVKVFLEGALLNGSMRDDLRIAGLIPLIEPYTDMGEDIDNSGAFISSSVLSTSGSSAIIDWVLIDLLNSSSTSVYKIAALIQSDGDIVATDGVSNPSVPLNGQYYIRIIHRNHLGVTTAFPVNISDQIDFRVSTTSTYGCNSQKQIGPWLAMWSGDVTFDGRLQYTGINNDRDPILFQIGGVIPTDTFYGYSNTDLNMDGWTKYTGTNNDRDIILFNIGGTVPTQIKLEEIPFQNSCGSGFVEGSQRQSLTGFDILGRRLKTLR